jgi:hypothetical protein
MTRGDMTRAERSPAGCELAQVLARTLCETMGVVA